jgi:hypothetical protein
MMASSKRCPLASTNGLVGSGSGLGGGLLEIVVVVVGSGVVVVVVALVVDVVD